MMTVNCWPTDTTAGVIHMSAASEAALFTSTFALVTGPALLALPSFASTPVALAVKFMKPTAGSAI
jgi:hypothetical protein